MCNRLSGTSGHTRAPNTYAGNKQHTFIETETVRYVYQPIENLFLLLVTNKASNIVEDLETLRMLSKGEQNEPRSAALWSPFARDHIAA